MPAEKAANLAKRDEIIRHGYQAFYRHGFHTTAIDQMLADSGISKRTVYKYFRSKEELIEAAVHYYQQLSLTQIAQELDRRSQTAAEKILIIFDLKYESMLAGNLAGCFAINAKLEYKGKYPAIERACTEFLNRLADLVLTLTKETGCATPDMIAGQLMVLLHGAIIYSQAQGDPAIILNARAAAAQLLAASHK